MATFLPLKHYMFYLLDQFIERYSLKGPFLDIGCGVGDVAAYLGSKNWKGKGIDFSATAVEMARRAVADYPGISIEKIALADEKSVDYGTILLWDVIEHIEDDRSALTLASSHLASDGMMLISVPSNPREWRWDDEMVGHYRRYTVARMTALLHDAGLEPVEFWDFTFPLFWAMRRGYTRLNLNRGKKLDPDLEQRTKASAIVHTWHIPVIGNLLNRPSSMWRLVYLLQFTFFRHATESWPRVHRAR